MGKRAYSILENAGYWPVHTAPAALVALVNLACERPGFDPYNYVSPGTYGDAYKRGVAAYRADARHAAKGLREVAAAARDAFFAGVTNDDLQHAAQGGRVELEYRDLDRHLSSKPHDPPRLGWTAHYCAGQYYPTEYRGAIARVIRDAATRAARRRSVGQ